MIYKSKLKIRIYIIVQICCYKYKVNGGIKLFVSFKCILTYNSASLLKGFRADHFSIFIEADVFDLNIGYFNVTKNGVPTM